MHAHKFCVKNFSLVKNHKPVRDVKISGHILIIFSAVLICKEWILRTQWHSILCIYCVLERLKVCAESLEVKCAPTSHFHSSDT